MNLKTKDQISSDRLQIFEFAEFSFDAGKKLLWRGGETVSLAPKACELLGVLIENAPEVLSREELMSLVWADAFVEEANLTHHISALRKALGEDKNGRKFIETIPRKGYRFVAPLVEADHGTTEIVISERTIVRTVETEEIESETIEKAVAAEHLPVSNQPVNLPVLHDNAAGKRRPGLFLFAGFCLAGALVVAGFFARSWFSGRSRQTVVQPQAFIPKRLMPDIDAVDPALSPDGKTAAFTWYKNGQSSVWQKNLASGEMTQLTHEVSLSDHQINALRYSPDGLWLYYAANDYATRRRGLYRMNMTGGSPQTVLEEVNEMDGEFGFSPDGRKIVYRVTTRLYGTSLVIVDLETKERRVLAERRTSGNIYGFSGIIAPGWSPDGRRIVIGGLSETGGQRTYELIEIDAETGAEKILPMSEPLRVYEVEWLADGSGILATASAATGLSKQIVHISYPDGRVTRLTDEDVNYDYIRLSQDTGTMIAGKDVGSVNLWTAEANDLAARKQITIGGTAQHGIKSLAFAPDGRIIYSSPAGGSLDIWSVTGDGGDPRQLTKNAGRYNEAHYVTPDNRYLIFNSIRSGNNQIWRIDLDGGGNPLQLSKTDRQSFSEALSPDGKWVYYTSFLPDQTTPQIYKVSIDGGEPVPLDDRSYVTTPFYSPDGKLLIFAGRDENNAPLGPRVIEAATGQTIVPPEKYPDGIWSADSRHLIDARSAGQELWQYDVYTGKDEKLADMRPWTIYNYAVSPDGRKYVFALGNISSETVLFTNYLGGGK